MVCKVCSLPILEDKPRIVYYKFHLHIACFVDWVKNLRKRKEASDESTNLALVPNPTAVNPDSNGNGHFPHSRSNEANKLTKRIERCRSRVQGKPPIS